MTRPSLQFAFVRADFTAESVFPASFGTLHDGTVPESETAYEAGEAFVSSVRVAARVPAPCGAKRTHNLHVSPPGSGPRHVEAPMKKSSAAGPLKLSPTM